MDIADVTPQETKTAKAIVAYWKQKGDADSRPSRRLGASSLGKQCERALWYQFRHCGKTVFSGRMYRLFDRGQLEEPRVVSDLEGIGCEVHAVDPNTGEQITVTACGGHFVAKLDGAVLGVPDAPKTWHVLEVKTHSAKSFNALRKKGVLDSKPEHCAQVQIEMHLTGMTRALYIAVNKDTDDLYVERIRYEKDYCESLLERAERVIYGNQPPEGISDRSDFYLCKFCDSQGICHGPLDTEPPFPVAQISCRQCCYSTPSPDGVDGTWHCEKHEKAITYADHLAACEHHLILPCLMPRWGAEWSGDSIVFSRSSGTNGDEEIANGRWETGRFNHSSEELSVVPLTILLNPVVSKAKALFGGAVGEPQLDIMDRYPMGDCEVLWSGAIDADSIKAAWVAKVGHAAPLVPLCSTNLPTHSASEYDEGFVVMADYTTNTAYILKGKR